MNNVRLKINGQWVSAKVESRNLLSQFLRDHLNLTGTHVGCDTTQCGCCIVHVDGVGVKSCTALTVMFNGAEVTTIEGLSNGEVLHPMQRAFQEHHGLQCGFCTPGMLTTLTELLAENPSPTEAQVKSAISGNLCRCTGYQPIVDATILAASRLRGPLSPSPQ